MTASKHDRLSAYVVKNAFDHRWARTRSNGEKVFIWQSQALGRKAPAPLHYAASFVLRTVVTHFAALEYACCPTAQLLNGGNF